MDNRYDTVLKEKKKYEDVLIKDDRIFIRKHIILIDIIITLILLLISFIIYYNTILKPYNIIYNDISIFDKYISTFANNLISGYNFNNNYNLSGNINISLDTNIDSEEINYLNNLDLDYKYMDNDKDLFINIKGEKYNLEYTNINNLIFLKLLNINDNIIKYDSTYNISINDYKYFINKLKIIIKEEIKKIDYQRKVYVNSGRLIVEISTNISGTELNDIYKNTINILNNDNRCKNIIDSLNLNETTIVSSESKYNLVIKNDLLDNTLKNIKLVINDGSNRRVINYSDNNITYKTDDDTYKLNINISNNDNTLKLYKNDEISYVLSGKGTNKSYIYNYQVINVIDNVSLQVKKNDKKNEYTLSLKKEKEDNYLNMFINIDVNYDSNTQIDNTNNKDYIIYTNLAKEEKNNIDNYLNKINKSLNAIFKIY